MLYFAEIFGKGVYASDGSKVGVLTDLLLLGQGQPLVTKLVVKTPMGIIRVPISNAKINKTIQLVSGFIEADQANNELSLKRSLLDQQILDIMGNKVVRVNDVAIQEKPYPIIAGVDVGTLGILRWFHIEKFINKSLSTFGTSLSSDFLPWEDIQPLELAQGKVVLKREEEKLMRLPPEDLADHLERLSVKNVTRILNMLDSEYEAEVVQNLNLTNQKELFKTIKPQRAARILDLVDPDEAVDILLALPHKRREAICKLFDEEKQKEITYLLGLSRTDIGSLLTTEFMAVPPEETVSKVRQRIKKETQEFESLNYIYVTNKKSELIGVFTPYELLIQEMDTPVYKFMTPQVIVLNLTTPRETALKRMIKYKLYGLPVIDNKRMILGIVTIEDLISYMEERHA